ncbi:MAG: hypothetical protein ACRD3H_06240 [Terriglobales bacterium]
MSDDTHIDGQNQEVEFERQDLGAKPILLFLISLTVACLLLALILKGMYSYLDAYEDRHQPVQNPLVPRRTAETRSVSPSDIEKFPQPRLESNERLEINDFRMQEEKTLNSYGWVDQPAGVVHIPIERAMQLLAQRGLPTRPQSGTAPSSDVNMAREAARRSDTSRMPAKKK